MFPYKGQVADFNGAPLKNMRVHPGTAFTDVLTPWNKGLMFFDTNVSGLHLWFMQADAGVTGDWIKIPRLDVAESVTAAWDFAKTGSSAVPFTVAANATGKVTNLNVDQVDGWHAVSNPASAAVQNLIPVYDTSGTLRGATPTASDHFATKAYVDGVATGLRALVGGPARFATTGVIADLTAVSTTMDGGTIVAGDRILVKDTASPDGIAAASHAYDGVYVAGTPGGGTVALTRATDADTTAELTTGAYILVTAGTVNAGHSYIQTVLNPTVNTTALNWVLFFQTSTYSAGNGLDLTGTVFSLKVNNTTSWTANGLLYGATTTTLGTSANLTYASGVLGVINSGVGFQHTQGSLVLATKNDGTTASIGTTSNHALTFMANNATVGTITAAGKLGIGTASPGAFVHSLGTSEQIRAAYDASNYLSISVGSAGASAFTTAGTGAGFTFTMTNNAAFTVAGGSVTGSGATGLLVMSDTWNTSGTPTLIYANVSDSSSNAASLLMSLAVGGSSKWSVRKDGYMLAGQTSIVYSTTGVDFADCQLEIRSGGTGKPAHIAFHVNGILANHIGSDNTTLRTFNQAGTDYAPFRVSVLTASSAAIGTVSSGTWNGTAIGVAYGGTGLALYAVGDLIYASGTTTLARLADVATGSVLISGGVGVAPSWSQVTGITGVGALDTGSIVNGFGDITIAGTVTAGVGLMVNFTALQVTVSGLTASRYVKTAGGGQLAVVASIPFTDITGTIPATQGGTGQTSYAVGDLLYASTTTALSKLADVATGRVLISGGVGVAPSWSQTTGITGVGALTAGSIATGFGSITIAGTITAGALASTSAAISGTLTAGAISSGAISSSAGISATALTLTETALGSPGTGTLEYDSTNHWLYFTRIYSGSSVARLKVGQIYTVNVGDGASTSITITHNLGTSNPAAVSLRKASTSALWSCDVVVLNANQLRLDFGTAPTSNEFVLAVVG